MLLTTRGRYGRIAYESPFREDARLTRVTPSSLQAERDLNAQHSDNLFICMDDDGLNHYDVTAGMVARERSDLP